MEIFQCLQYSLGTDGKGCAQPWLLLWSLDTCLRGRRKRWRWCSLEDGCSPTLFWFYEACLLRRILTLFCRFFWFSNWPERKFIWNYWLLEWGLYVVWSTWHFPKETAFKIESPPFKASDALLFRALRVSSGSSSLITSFSSLSSFHY